MTRLHSPGEGMLHLRQGARATKLICALLNGMLLLLLHSCIALKPQGGMFGVLQALILDLNDARPAPLQKDDPALLEALWFVATEMGPFYTDRSDRFEVGNNPAPMHLTIMSNLDQELCITLPLDKNTNFAPLVAVSI